MILFIAVIAAIMAFCLWVMIHNRKNLFAILCLTPLILGGIIYSYSTYNELIGYPTTELTEKEVRLVGTYVDEPRAIYLWVLEDGVPRAYKLPYTKNDRKRTKGAGRQLRKGKIVMMKRTKGSDSESEYKFYVLPNPKWLNK